ncbi:MAG: hypothetical protein BJ554DRAFT_4178 [Olpidium bornovanus]|uniref:Uncharacterized protein n=1 Tax=Olpidium bornovanus TaxID=278681 RepID=A0A8H8A0G3_9FUNG|nr:MAG: hypothetical protein BJ554DRAFT_4178 [Olpidium bornovanus]
MELCAKGFATWEPHFNAAAVVRTLLALSSNSSSSPVQVKSAQRALVQIGTVNTLLFVTTITYDLVHSKSAAEKTAILKVISYFIYKVSASIEFRLTALLPFVHDVVYYKLSQTWFCCPCPALYPLLPKIVEGGVKALDPNVHQMRQAILKTATATLHDLVKFYPPVAFHGGAQRLAVGTMEGATVLYDLRTATRWHVIEGHVKPVTAVAFSPDGRNVVTCSFEEGTLKTWHPTAGLLGMITGSMNSNAASTKPIKTLPIKVEGDEFC